MSVHLIRAPKSHVKVNCEMRAKDWSLAEKHCHIKIRVEPRGTSERVSTSDSAALLSKCFTQKHQAKIYTCFYLLVCVWMDGCTGAGTTTRKIERKKKLFLLLLKPSFLAARWYFWRVWGLDQPQDTHGVKSRDWNAACNNNQSLCVANELCCVAASSVLLLIICSAVLLQYGCVCYLRDHSPVCGENDCMGGT